MTSTLRQGASTAAVTAAVTALLACGNGHGRNDGSGGAPATGGGSGEGGASSTAGSGGLAGTGGILGSGGSGKGGETAGGGATGFGGRTAAGGVRTGGTTATGGVPAGAGGTAGAGGATTSPGACQEATCGSHKWACWKVPTPPSEKLPNPQSYTDLGSGAVRDNVTCLVWEKANPATQGTWQASFDRCASLASAAYAGFSDWRLPTRMEMASIIDPTLGSKGFPAVFTTTSGYYATASWWYETITGQSTSGFHFGYGTNGFTSNAVAMGGTNLVARCVRGGGAGEAADELAVEPPGHYTVDSGEVTDHYTGLVWQQRFSPGLMEWDAAPAYCAGLTLNGHTGFRVPTLGELSSTVNEAKVGGAIVASAFPGNPNGCKDPKYWFWAAEASKVGGTAWGLSYCDGFTGYNVGKSGDWNYFPTANVRCVRNAS